MFIYPDRPALTLGADFLDQIDPELYFCTLKIDGWRCVVSRKDGVYDYRSRANKPIDVPASVRALFEIHFVNVLGNFVLDCELTGKRRVGDVEGIVILEMLELWDINHRKQSAYSRWNLARSIAPLLAVPGCEKDFRKFFDHHKEHTPLAEGVVLKQRSSKLIGSPITCAETSAWIKVKWRAGSSGLSPTEV